MKKCISITLLSNVKKKNNVCFVIVEAKTKEIVYVGLHLHYILLVREIKTIIILEICNTKTLFWSNICIYVNIFALRLSKWLQR